MPVYGDPKYIYPTWTPADPAPVPVGRAGRGKVVHLGSAQLRLSWCGWFLNEMVEGKPQDVTCKKCRAIAHIDSTS